MAEKSNVCPEKISSELKNEELISRVNELEAASTGETSQIKNYLGILSDGDLKKINDLQCPFSWKAYNDINNFGDHEVDLLSEFEEIFEESKFEFRRFVKHLTASFHNYYRHEVKESLENIEYLQKMILNSSKRYNADSVLFNSITDALFHIVHASQFYLYVYTEMKEKALKLLSRITPYSELSNENKAGILGIRAGVYAEHGYDGIILARNYINQAIVLAPENAHLYFMKGTFLGRLRRMGKNLEPPSADEINSLEEAINLRADPLFYAFTAEVYMEYSKIFAKYNEEITSTYNAERIEYVNKKLDKMNRKSVKLFKKSVEMRPNSAHLLFRCGKSLMKFPEPYKDVKLGSTYIRNGLELDPESSFGNHAMAIYKEKYKSNKYSSIKYLEKAVKRNNFNANMDLCRLKFLQTENCEELLDELKRMVTVYVEDPKLYKIMGEMTCHFLFLDFDLPSACNCMMKMLTLRSKWEDNVNTFHSHILPLPPSTPLIDIICSSIRHKLEDIKIAKHTKDIYAKFIKTIIEGGINSTVEDMTLRKKYCLKLIKGIEKLRKEGYELYQQYQKGKSRNKTNEPYEAPNKVLSKEQYKYYEMKLDISELNMAVEWLNDKNRSGNSNKKVHRKRSEESNYDSISHREQKLSRKSKHPEGEHRYRKISDEYREIDGHDREKSRNRGQSDVFYNSRHSKLKYDAEKDVESPSLSEADSSRDSRKKKERRYNRDTDYSEKGYNKSSRRKFGSPSSEGENEHELVKSHSHHNTRKNNQRERSCDREIVDGRNRRDHRKQSESKRRGHPEENRFDEDENLSRRNRMFDPKKDFFKKETVRTERKSNKNCSKSDFENSPTFNRKNHGKNNLKEKTNRVSSEVDERSKRYSSNENVKTMSIHLSNMKLNENEPISNVNHSVHMKNDNVNSFKDNLLVENSEKSKLLDKEINKLENAEKNPISNIADKNKSVPNAGSDKDGLNFENKKNNGDDKKQ